MRFDDTLATVLASDVSTAFGMASAWRQLIDLIGRGRVPADARALALLEDIRAEVPLTVRAASARGLEVAQPPFGLVALCARDDISVAAPVLRGARLSLGEWIELLPQLTAAARGVLRGRRDLPAGVEEALALFTGDFAIEGEVTPTPAGTIAELLGRIRERPLGEAVAAATTPEPEPAVETAEPEEAPAPVAASASNSTFVSVGAAAKSIPVVAAALQQAVEGEESADAGVIQNETGGEIESDAALAPESGVSQDSDMPSDNLILIEREQVDAVSVQEASGEIEGPFEIADVVARIDAFYERREQQPASPKVLSRAEGFRFETDAQGVIRWVEGVTRTPVIGMSLDLAAMPRSPGVDGVVAGAFRRRAAFSDARLVVAGNSDAAGDWRISGSAAFDPATGRFAGYRGTARRPRLEDDAAKMPQGRAADSLRQLMHELRTPTNAIAGFAEMIDRQMLGEAPDVYRARAAVIRDEARALLAAIDDLDIAARMESSALQLQPGEVAVRPLLVRIAEDLAVLGTARGAAIDVSVENAIVMGDPRAVERLLSRLLATLVSAAGKGEVIRVRIADGGERVAITFDRPAAFAAYTNDALFGIDDEREDATLLGTGFALRLIRNLARELSGSLVIEAGSLTVRLPAAVTKSLEVVR